MAIWCVLQTSFSVFAPLITLAILHTADHRERVLAEMLREDCLRYISGMAPLLLRYVPSDTPYPSRLRPTSARRTAAR